MNTPIWVTLLVAGLVLLGTIYSAWQSRSAAKANAEAAASASTSAADIAASASKFAVRSDRFADWQMHKRKVYSELLAAVRHARAVKTSEADLAMAIHFDQALLIAEPDLYLTLRTMQGSVFGQNAIDDDSLYQTWHVVISKMRKDIDPAARIAGDDEPPENDNLLL